MNIDENLPSLDTLFAPGRALAGAVQTLAAVTRSRAEPVRPFPVEGRLRPLRIRPLPVRASVRSRRLAGGSSGVWISSLPSNILEPRPTRSRPAPARVREARAFARTGHPGRV